MQLERKLTLMVQPSATLQLSKYIAIFSSDLEMKIND